MDIPEKLQALEIEAQSPDGVQTGSRRRHDASDGLMQKIYQLARLLRLYVSHYPRIAAAIVGGMILLLLPNILFRHRGKVRYVPPHMKNHYGDVQSFYDLKMAKIDHWCLRGGDDDCQCQDPTMAASKEEALGWLQAHVRNKLIVETAPRDLDVVFVGDDIIQAWSGYRMNSRISPVIPKLFNETFHKNQDQAVFEAIPLGIARDTVGNLLWRLDHGEMPIDLQPKVWWIYIGTNDLVSGECSEEAVTLGILQLADYIATSRPDCVVVIQSLMPRSTMRDGTVDDQRGRHKRAKVAVPMGGGKAREYFKRDEYPFWPSIRAINLELEKFCENHDHVVFFDADQLFLGTLGNKYYASGQKKIVKELMPDFKRLSKEGHEVLLRVISDEVKRIIFEKDERNFKAGGGR